LSDKEFEATAKQGFFRDDWGTPTELAAERKKELIEKMADFVVNREMETMAILSLESIKLLAPMAAQLAIPFLTPYFGILSTADEVTANEIITLFMERDNVEQIMRRIEEKSDVIRKKMKEKRERKKKLKSGQPEGSLLQRLKKKLTFKK
jgi:hypothetical protein